MEMASAKHLAASILMLLACTQVLAVEPAKKAAVLDQPDIVIGGSAARAKSLTVPVAIPVAGAASAGRAWSVETRDVNLANTFQRWAGISGWRVRWDASMHVMVEAPDTFSGSFEDAITSQLSSPGIANSAYPLEVCFYPNTPPLARITRKGDQAKDCQ